MKLLFLGIDGLRPDGLLFSNSPIIKNLLLHGTYTFDSYINSTTMSGPSWSCILSGKTENITEVFNNDTVLDDNFKWKCNNVFSILNSMNVKTTSLVSHWKGMANLVQDSSNKIYMKAKSFEESDKIIINETIKRINDSNIKQSFQKNEFIFTYIIGIDEIGHEYGFSLKTKEYIQYIEKIDSLLEPLIKICDDWNIIITTDHGGCNYNDLEEKQKSDFLSKGYNVEKGIHGLNISQHKRVFQIYYGKIFKNKELLDKRNNTDICKDIIDIFRL